MAAPPSVSPPIRAISEKRWFLPYLRREAPRLATGIGLVCLTNVFQLSLPYLSKRAIDALQASQASQVRWLAYLIAAVALTQAVIRVFSRMYLLDAGRQVEFKLRGDLFQHLTRMTPKFYGRIGVGDVMSRCVNDLGQVRLLIGPGLLMLVNAVAAYAVALPAMLGLDPLLTAFALGPYVPLLFLLQRQAKQVFIGMRAVQDELGVLSVRIQENLAGQLSVKSFGREASEQVAFAERNDAYLNANLGLARARATLQLLFGAIGGLGAVAVLGVGGYAVIHGRLTLGGYTAFSGYLAELSMRSSMLGFFLAGWQRGRASLARVREVMEEAPEFVDPAPGIQRRLAGDIDVSELTVRYGERRVLDGVSLRVARGHSLAVVGKTGAGKTTLLSALARLVDVPAGSVRYDGLDVRDWPLSDLRRQVGLVPQEPFLFSATLGQNIALGRPEASTAEIEAAAEAARLAVDLRALPEGLATEVGERGVTLSGGQRSRTALARALLVDPRVLLLDDPFANVDADTARALWEEIEAAASGAPADQRPTRILVTHRLALAMACDEIAVLENGKLVERGGHDDLLARGGAYARLFVREQILEQLKEVG
jgi:ATP-binding cassette subfamily B multidrug efflux pump